MGAPFQLIWIENRNHKILPIAIGCLHALVYFTLPICRVCFHIYGVEFYSFFKRRPRCLRRHLRICTNELNAIAVTA